MLMITFGKRLRELRTERKLSQQELAKIIGTNNSSICDWERGRSEPGLEALVKLCQFFDVSSDYLIGMVDY
ncbi:MAG: helix-turn-helix transcriptional regulator [Candidatus Borkfalkiaceae bacterium]|nr:helix-turn-helix transcriptional regulator [Christensenellaceae bacterium]